MSFDLYSGHMTTAQHTPLGASIIQAMNAAGTNPTAVSRALGIKAETFKKRLASDKFTVQDIVDISRVTGVKASEIMAPVLSQAVAA